jgi:hypothetical protein
MLFAHPVGLRAAVTLSLHLLGDARDPQLWLTVDALCLKSSMIDARFQMGLPQKFIGGLGPALPHVQKLADSRPKSRFPAPCITPFECGLGAQAGGRHFAGGCQQVCVEVSGVTAGKISRLMNGEINRESISLDQFF